MRREMTLYVPRDVAEQRALRPDVVEYRDPKAATQAITFRSPGLGQHFDWDADQAFRLGYLANVIAFRCVQLCANAIASVPIVVGPRKGKPRADQDASPLGRLVGPPPGGPAPKLSARRLIRWTIAQQIVTGRRAWEIETADGKPDGVPVALWPLVAARLQVEPSEGGTEWFRVFRYGRADRPRILQPGQVLYGWDPSGLDFRQPESALMSARFDLSLVTLCDRYSLAFLSNNATPATVVTTAAFPDDDTRRAFRQQWAAEFGGVSNAGRTHFNEVDGEGPVGDAIDVRVLGLSQKDAQLLEQRKEALVEVAMALGTPWSKLDASGRTFDNAEVEDRSWWEDTLLPLMSDLEDDINMQLAPRLGNEVCWFDLRQVRTLRRRKFTSLEGAAALLDRQVIVPNEVREDLDLPPVEWGDEPLEITQDIPGLPAAADVDDVSADAGDRGVGDAGNREDRTGEPGEPSPAPRHEPERRALDPDAMEARRARIWRTADATVRALESSWERAWRRLFARQERATVSRLEGNRGRRVVEQRGPADEVFDRGFWLAETYEEALTLFEQVAATGMARVADLFGIAFDLEVEWARQFIVERANMLAGQVTDTTYRAITEQLAEGVGAGEGIPELVDRVRAVFADASERRAEVIARTEVISAYNGAATLSAAALPPDVVGGREWIATRDGRTRPAHAAADGQVVAMDAPFTVGGDTLLYPGDPAGRAGNTIQCRCTVAFLTPDEMAERGVEASSLLVDVARARRYLSLVTPETDLLAFRRALTEEVRPDAAA